MKIDRIRSNLFLCLLWIASLMTSTEAQVKIERIAYFNQPNCYKLTNGTVELIVTTDIGPRIIRYGFIGEDNILGEALDVSLKTELGEWKAWGGHRLWLGPEAIPRSYSPDNSPIEFKIEGTNSIRLIQPVEPKTGVQKEMLVTLDQQGTGVTVHHKLTNRNLWSIEVAPWALTIMNGGGTILLPQEPYRSHADYVLPARPMVMWHYTNLSDPRWTIGKKYIQLKVKSDMNEPQKIGIANKQGWAAYHRAKTLFIKRFDYKEGANYPDYGCNTEVFTRGSFAEVETLGPMHRLDVGGAAEHTERWQLFPNIDVGTTEATIDSAIGPLVAKAAEK